MKLDIPHAVISACVKAGSKNRWFLDKQESGYDGISYVVEHTFLKAEDIARLKKACEHKDHVENRRVLKVIRQLKQIAKINEMSKDAINQTFGTLEALAEAIKAVFKNVPRHWFFVNEDDLLQPYLLTSVDYVPPNPRQEIKAHVNFEGTAYKRGKKVEWSESWYRADMRSNNIGGLMQGADIVLATDELIEEYEQEIEIYNSYAPQTGEQFYAEGDAEVINQSDAEESEEKRRNRWLYGGVGSVKLGKVDPSRVVMDDDYFLKNADEDRESEVVTHELFGEDPEMEDDSEIDADETVEKEGVALPLHPYVVVFDLKKHRYVETHVMNLKPYVYDSTLAAKLVLPANRRELIDVLLASAQNVQQDIVKGKTGGTIILCSGQPGTGKTLTAEVYAETAARPLYVVQCSQLGTDPEELENKLANALERSVRWNAILLIDEADVYIHERGDDLVQNAIVSRMMAHVRYTIPQNKEEYLRLWKTLSAQYKVGISEALMHELINKYTKISGRSIKQMLKLAKVLVDTGKRKLDFALFEWLAQFQDIEDSEVKT